MRRFRGLRSRSREMTLLAIAALFCVAVVPVAVGEPVLAGSLGGLLVVVIIVLALGTERASTFFLVVAFFFAPLTNFSLGATYVVAASGFFGLALLLALPTVVRRRLQLPPVFVIGSVLFVTMGLAATALAVDPFSSLAYTVTSAVALVGIPIAMVWMAPTDRQMYAMAIAFGLGVAASTLYGLDGYVYRNPGFTYHPVALAYTAMLALSYVPYILVSKGGGRWILVPPIVVIACIGIWTSGSRTSLVVLAALVVLVPVFERWLKTGLLVAAAIAITLPYAATYDPSQDPTSALSRLYGQGGAAASDSTRLSTLRTGLELAAQNPIVGDGYNTEITYVIHNLYLQVLQAEGVIGLVGLLMMLGVLLTPLRRGTLPRRCLAYPALAVVLAGAFQPNMGDHYLGMALGLALVAAVSSTRSEPEVEGLSEVDAVSPKEPVRDLR